MSWNDTVDDGRFRLGNDDPDVLEDLPDCLPRTFDVCRRLKEQNPKFGAKAGER